MSLTTNAKALHETLGLKWAPISITFRTERPSDMERIDERAASGCAYWKLAAEGKIFYTEAEDHYGCPIGAYTHGVQLPPDQRKELEGMIETMVGLSYLKMEEVSAIPKREEPFRFAIYAPLADAPADPDVVIVRGNAKQIMLLAEAANAAGVSPSSTIMGRPTCAMIPAVAKSGQSAISLGCIGNRVYNELTDDEFYVGISGEAFASTLEKVLVTVNANDELFRFHRKRNQ
jgi:uncharacterized protein (DUF169 family)